VLRTLGGRAAQLDLGMFNCASCLTALMYLSARRMEHSPVSAQWVIAHPAATSTTIRTSSRLYRQFAGGRSTDLRTWDDMGWTLRSTSRSDRPAVLAVVREAFSGTQRDGEFEVDIVGRTWALAASPEDLDLVAVDDGAIVAHALGALGDLGARKTLAVAPLCVAPSRQREGIGAALMTEMLRRAEADLWPMVLVLGDPGYYRRFGFEPSGPLGIHYRAIGRGDPHFQVCRLAQFDPSLRGEFTYCWEGGLSSPTT
jgi:putative acetyltransferase